MSLVVETVVVVVARVQAVTVVGLTVLAVFVMLVVEVLAACKALVVVEAPSVHKLLVV